MHICNSGIGNELEAYGLEIIASPGIPLLLIGYSPLFLGLFSLFQNTWIGAAKKNMSRFQNLNGHLLKWAVPGDECMGLLNVLQGNKGEVDLDQAVTTLSMLEKVSPEFLSHTQLAYYLVKAIIWRSVIFRLGI